MKTITTYQSPDLWTDLAARCYISRTYAKNIAFEIAYSADATWERHVVACELEKMLNVPVVKRQS